jgi:hypothetical protein
MVSHQTFVCTWKAALRCALALGALLIFSACDAVISNQPMGEMPKSIDWDEQHAWEGVWLLPGEGTEDDRLITIRAVDRENGILTIGALNSDYNSYQFVDVVVRATGEHLYANLSDGNSYQWLKFEAKEKYMLLWLPRASKFEQAVTDGLLKGFVIHDVWSTVVHLTDLTEQQSAVIAADDQYFHGPLVLIKVGNRAGPDLKSRMYFVAVLLFFSSVP